MFPVGHVELLFVISLAAIVHVAALVFLIVQVVDSRKTLAESRRMDTVIGTLVIQEAEKIRQLVRGASLPPTA